MRIEAIVWNSNYKNVKLSSFNVEPMEGRKRVWVEQTNKEHINLFTEYKGVYFSIANTTDYIIKNIIDSNELRFETDEQVHAKYLNKFPSMLVLKVIEMVGEDLEPYLEYRKQETERQRRENNQRIEEKIQRDNQRAEQEKQEETELFQRIETALEFDKLILCSDLIAFAKSKGIKLNPRTVGSIMANSNRMEVSLTTVRNFDKGTRKSTLLSYTKFAQYILNEFKSK